MSAFAVWLDDADKGTFRFIRTVFQSDFLEQNSGLLGDMKAWVPFLVFLAIVTYLTKPGAGVFSLFFGLASFILSFQAAMLLAKIIFQPSPVQLEYLHHSLELPAYGRALGVSLPDWGIAALAGVFHFARLRLKQLQGPNLMAMWALVFVFALMRIYAGYTYPIGAIMAALVGILVGWLMFQLLRSVELLTPPLSAESGSESDDDLR
ncbi:MAG: hypothetical protein IPN95_02875 [Bacteroidetes bacterium]|jgi:hypothetical protein|nr:hypothetical protein [Bacteroidota bacterium]MBL0018016.1 hypothetical protein [Bacteroidota bacterium]MBP6639493.1 hypothetical protein [Bacteroidia bacterium]MBP6721308.1 hypothetical protein [Bacteroidia bacterium]MBP8073322.1 hypothetical protein [Bacteroidia bacterium]